MTAELEGAAWARGEEGYEQARRASVRNARVPDRHPELIVRPRGEQQVVAAVALARDRGMRIGIRSGGHSWAASFLRDGGMLLDLSEMNAAEIDAGSRTAVVGPGTIGTDLNRRLAEDDLFFPTGHCTSVGLGGFLLQGGFGWNSRLWGPACVGVEAIDVVTAAGDLVRADEDENADLYWAARGAGPGFFGVVTAFHLRLRQRPRAMMVSRYVFPIESLEAILRWVGEIQPSISPRMELMVYTRRGLTPRMPGPGVMLLGPVLADSEEQAVDDLAILESCPELERAVVREVNRPTDIDELLRGSDEFYPEGRRFAADNVWSDAPVERLIPGAKRIAETLPGSPSHMMWLVWGPCRELPEMAFSMQADTYIAVYAVYDDERVDAEHQAWVTDRMRELEPHAVGIQLADENLGRRPFPFLSEPNMRRLERIREQRDPEGLFHSYMGIWVTSA